MENAKMLIILALTGACIGAPNPQGFLGLLVGELLGGYGESSEESQEYNYPSYGSYPNQGFYPNQGYYPNYGGYPNQGNYQNYGSYPNQGAALGGFGKPGLGGGIGAAPGSIGNLGLGGGSGTAAGIGTGTANQNGVSATGVGFANAQNGGLSMANGQGQASNLFGFGPQASGTGNGVSIGK